MLDDLRKIHERDAQDALGVAEKQWQQLEYAFDVPELPSGIEHIVYAGMGGSALAGLMSQSWPGYRVPFEIVRDYHVPAYVSGKTLFVAASYSGNTEETLSALAEAETRGAQIAVIASGGKLQAIAQEKGYPFVLLPATLQARQGVLYNFRALVLLLDKAGLVAASNAQAELQRAAAHLHDQIQKWLPTVPTKSNLAKQIALECMGKSVVVYAGTRLAPAAYRWKTAFNENAKQLAWWGQYSECSHNEFMGWAEQPEQKPYAVIDLRSNLDHPQVQKRFELSAKLLSGKRPSPVVVEASGDTPLEQLLTASALGDFASIYTALLGNINPTPVELVERFKKELEA